MNDQHDILFLLVRQHEIGDESFPFDSAALEIQRLRTDNADLEKQISRLNTRVAELLTEIDRARKALKPFSACVFNDNGDVAITTSNLRIEDYMMARAAMTNQSGAQIVSSA